MDGGGCWTAICGVTQSRTQLKQLSSSGNFVPLSFIAFNYNNSIEERRFLKYSRWQKVVMAKCQGKDKRKRRVIVKLGFTVTIYHGG